MKLSRLVFLFVAALLAAAAVSCRDADPASAPEGRTVEVLIGLPETRTTIDDDGLSTLWEKGDRMVLWAYKEGAAAFSGAPFAYYGSKSGAKGRALFSGTVAAMAAGTYTYYAASPVPAATADTRVSYDLPAVQDGAWHGEWDVLLASASAPELEEHMEEQDNVNSLDLRFRHKVHALKVSIPSGRNRFGRPVKRLRAEFPRPVAGRLTWDLASPDAAAEMAQASNVVTLEFARPVGEGDSFWIFIAPGDMTGGVVRFTATDGTDFSWPIESGAFHNLEPGQITSVTLTIPALRPQTDYRLTVDPAQLGEAVTEIAAVELPEGYSFPSLDLALRQAGPLAANDDGTFSLRIFKDMSDDFPAELGLTVGSANTTGVVGKLGTGQCTVSGVTSTGCSIMAPYLFYEDFSSSINNNSHEEDDSGSELVVAGLPGWTGSRWKVDQQSLEFRTHISTAVGPSGEYGRVDSPVLPVRSGCSVKVSLHYEIGAAFSGGASTFQSRILPVCIFGLSSDLGAPSGGSNSKQNYPSTRIEEYTLGKDGSPTYQPTSKDNEISDVSDGMRLTWFGYFSRSGAAAVTGAKFYYYLDNIRVTIAQ